MRRQTAFTLFEVILAVFIGVLIFAFAIPSVEGFFKEQRLRRSFDGFDELVGEAHRLSVTERRAFLLVWEKEGILLRPELPKTKDEEAGISMIEAREGESYAISFPAALVKDPPREWVFWPSGNCEPAKITYQGAIGSWTASYDPLTTRVTEFENAAR
jgi:hypothetical protein